MIKNRTLRRVQIQLRIVTSKYFQYKSDLGNNEFQIDDSDTKDKKTHRIVLGAAIFESQDLLRRTCFI
jgi:hypothetical protein